MMQTNKLSTKMSDLSEIDKLLKALALPIDQGRDVIYTDIADATAYKRTNAIHRFFSHRRFEVSIKKAIEIGEAYYKLYPEKVEIHTVATM